jgi:hypothetical protein
MDEILLLVDLFRPERDIYFPGRKVLFGLDQSLSLDYDTEYSIFGKRKIDETIYFPLSFHNYARSKKSPCDHT